VANDQQAGSWESRECPTSVRTRLIAAGGLNRFGEPNYRVVWGQSRLTWIGGEWTETDAHGNENGRVIEERQVPKYWPYDRWYLEKWLPPEHYGSPDYWDETFVEMIDGIRIPSLGPYPHRGEYELCQRLETKAGDYAPLVEERVADIVRMIRAGETYSDAENAAAIWRNEEKKQKDYENYALDILNDENAFENKAHIYMPKALPKLSKRELRAIRYLDIGAKPQIGATV